MAEDFSRFGTPLDLSSQGEALDDIPDFSTGGAALDLSAGGTALDQDTTLLQDTANVGRAFASGVVDTPGMTLRGLGETYDVVARAIGRPVTAGLKAVGLEDVATFLNEPRLPWWTNPAEILRRPGEEVFGAAAKAVDVPAGQETIASDIGKGVGQLSAQITAAILSGGASGPTSLTMLFGQGVDQQRALREEYGGGETTPESDAALLAGGGITAALENFGLDKILNRLPPKVKNSVLRYLADITVAGGIEATQEVVEGVTQRLTAAAAYEEDIPILEGVDREAIAAGGAGAIARGVLNLVTPGRQRGSGEASQPATIEEVTTFAQQRLDALGRQETLTEPEQAERDFLSRNINDPGTIARQYGVELAPVGEREKAQAATPPPTQEDIDSPIPTDLIQEGKAVLQDAVGEQSAADILATVGFPPVNSRVTLTTRDGGTQSATLIDAFDDGGWQGAKLQLDDGRVISETFEQLRGRIKQEVQDAVPVPDERLGGAAPATADGPDFAAGGTPVESMVPQPEPGIVSGAGATGVDPGTRVPDAGVAADTQPALTDTSASESINSPEIDTSRAEEVTAMLPSDVQASIRSHNDSLNPKVAEPVLALNNAGIKTTMSGDLYGNDLVYVDVAEDAVAKLDPAKLPEGWKITYRNMNLTERDILGKPVPQDSRPLTDNIEANYPGDKVRLARAGSASVTLEEAAQLAQAFTKPEPRPARPVAESQAPATSEPGDAGVAPGQTSEASGPLRIEDYTDKSIIVRGQTRENVDRIKEAGKRAGVRALWNKKAQGWVFPKAKESQVRETLADLVGQPEASAVQGQSAPQPATESGKRPVLQPAGETPEAVIRAAAKDARDIDQLRSYVNGRFGRARARELEPAIQKAWQETRAPEPPSREAQRPDDRRQTPPEVREQLTPEEIRRLRAENEALRRQVDTDALTGVKSQAAYFRDAPKAGGVVQMDLTLFKGYNTLLTEDGGDIVLRAFGQAMLEVSPNAYRKGGDEFAFLVDTEAEARSLLAQMQETAAAIRFSMRDADGNPVTIEGIPFTGGVGANAEEALRDRDARKGVYDRNALPPNVVGQPRSEERAVQDRERQPARQETRPDAAEEVTGTITDFGEVLEGARKHVWEAYRDRLNQAGEVDVAAEPLSKSWPEPDYQKLIDDGADPWTVAFIRAARDEVPTKPQKGWKLRGWVEQVQTLRTFANDLLNGRTEKAAVTRVLADPAFARLRQEMEGRIDLYQAVGHAKSLKGVRLSEGRYSMWQGERHNPPLVRWSVERRPKATAFSNMPMELAAGATREEAIANFKAAYARIDTQPRTDKQVKFSIYSYRRGEKAGKWFIGKKIGKEYLDLRQFDTSKEAREYLAENQGELEKALERAKDIPDHRKESDAPRVGIDHRNGADVTPEQFSEAFGFRGVQFGNYVEGGRRQQDLNQAYDALMDLAGVLDVPPKSLSLNGELGLAFGARGKGGKRAARAHYESNTVVINLTKREGAGSLAHEWWHAADNYFSRRRGENEGFVSEFPQAKYPGDTSIRPEVVQAFRDLVQAINQTSLKQRSRGLDQRRTKAYWSTGREMSARAFESYIVAKLQDQGASNDYLANIVSEDYWNAAAALGVGEGTETQPDYPYPTAAEIPVIRAAFDNLFQAIETRETERGVEMFSLRPEATFYSALTRAAEGLKQAKGTPEQMLAALRNQPGVKAEEIEWTGLEEFMQLRGSQSVTKDEIVEYLRANGVQIRTVTHGGDAKKFQDAVQRLTRDGFDFEDDEYFGVTLIRDGSPVDPEELTERQRADLETLEEGQDADDPLNSGSTKYSQYTLPGGDNYREVLLTLPIKTEPLQQVFNEFKKKYPNWREGQDYKEVLSEQDQRRFEAAMNGHTSGEIYRSSHFDEPNILAHVRLKDFTDANGDKVLLIEEIQSDWHQAGRKKGYAGARKKEFDELTAQVRKAANNRLVSNTDAWTSFSMLNAGVPKELMDSWFAAAEVEEYGVPNAPFKGNAWIELATKRVLQFAVEGGYDRVAWTPGDIQNERYSLSAQIEELLVYRHPSGDQYDLSARTKGARRLKDIATRIDEKKLPDYIGKEMAERVVRDDIAGSTWKTYSGLDLKVGGEGMRGFYDNTLPNIIKSITRKLDKTAKFEQAALDISGAKATEFKDYDEWKATKDTPVNVPSIPITPAMREAIQAGLPLFTLRDEFVKNAQRVTGNLKARLEQLGIADKVALNLRERIQAVSDGIATEADGRYLRGVIEVSLTAQDGVRALNHEAIHAMRDLGLFNAAEWRTLEKAAKADTDRMEAVRRRYASLEVSDDVIVEETVAEMYVEWASDRSQAGGFLRRAFQKIRDFLSALGKALTGRGYNTVDDIFSAVERGEVGRRQPRDEQGRFTAEAEGRETARDEEDVTPRFSRASQKASPIQRGVEPEEATLLYRAHVRDAEVTIKAFTSWTPDLDTAEAYTDNPGFGGPNIRQARVDVSNTLDVGDVHGLVGKRQLADALGYEDAGETAQEWQDNGWRYPWEESGEVTRRLRNSGFDWLRYEDDFPSGATTMMPLHDIELEPPTEPRFSRAPQTDTPAFREWFGASKVVDENGDPLVVYHGTGRDRSEFFLDRDERGERGVAFFTDSPSDAEEFSQRGVAPSPNILPVYLSIQNLKTVNAKGEEFYPDQMKEWINDAKDEGHDGLKVRNIRNFESGSPTTTYVVFDSSTQIKSAIGNRGTFDPENPDIRFALRSQDFRPPGGGNPSPPDTLQDDDFHKENLRIRDKHRSLWDKAKQMLRRQFSPGGLLTLPTLEGVFDLKITRDSQFNVNEFWVRHLVGQLERGVKQGFGKPFRKLTEQQKRRLHESLAGKMDPLLPESVKVPLLAMRQFLDKQSVQYIQMLRDQMNARLMDAATSVEMSADDMRTVMIDAWRTEGDALENAKDDIRARLEAQGIEPKEARARVSSATPTLHDALSKASLSNTIAGNLGRYVHRSYRAFDDPKWNTKVPAAVLDDARRYLRGRHVQQGMGEAEAARRAEVAINEILKNGTAYDNIEGFIKESKLGAKDLSILKKREDIAPEIRALLGEYMDPRINFAKSSTKMNRLIYNEWFLGKVREKGMGVFLFEGDDRPPEATTQLASDGSAVMAPLNGLWTYPEVSQAFVDAIGQETMSGIMRTIVQLNGAVKFGKTVLSPSTAARNWQSAFFFTLANGHFDLRHMAKSVAGIREYFTQREFGDRTRAQARLDYLAKLLELGVVYDTPYADEMMKLLDDSRMEDRLLTGTATLPFRQALHYAQKFYQYGDDFWKIIGFENEKRMLMKHAGMTEAQAEKEAAERIRNTYPTYSMVGRFVQKLRRFPLAGTFVSFPSEIIRTSLNIVRYIAKDMKTPGMRAIAMKRAAGFGIAMSIFEIISEMSKALLGVDDEEEEAVRQMAAPWQRNSTFMFIGRDENGNLEYFDLSFLDPYNYLKRPIIAVLRDQPGTQELTDALGEILLPFFGIDIAAGIVLELVSNKKQGSGAPIYRETDPVHQQAADITTHLLEGIQLGLTSNLQRTWKAIDGQYSPSGKKYTLEDEGLAWIGWSKTTLDPKVGLYYRSFEFNDALTEAQDNLYDLLRTPNEVENDDLLDAYENTLRSRRRAFDDMGRIIHAARESGMTPLEIGTVLKSSGVSEANRNALLRGTVPAWEPTSSAERYAFDKAKAVFGPAKAAEIRRRYTITRSMRYEAERAARED